MVTPGAITSDLPAGTYTVTARALDALGNRSEPAAVDVTISRPKIVSVRPQYGGRDTFNAQSATEGEDAWAVRAMRADGGLPPVA